MSKLRGIILILLSLLPGACHYMFTAPALYAAGTNDALNAWWAFWILSICAVIFTVLWVTDKWQDYTNEESNE